MPFMDVRRQAGAARGTVPSSFFPRLPYCGCLCATIHPYQLPKLDEKSARYIDSLSCLPTGILCVCLFVSILDIMTQRGIHPLLTRLRSDKLRLIPVSRSVVG